MLLKLSSYLIASLTASVSIALSSHPSITQGEEKGDATKTPGVERLLELLQRFPDSSESAERTERLPGEANRQIGSNHQRSASRSTVGGDSTG